MSSHRKFYVVWEGRAPGVYDSWEEAQAQVEGYPGARYRGFTDQESAVEAFRKGYEDASIFFKALGNRGNRPVVNYTSFPEIRLDAIAVDAACSRNPGPVEYQGVNVADGSRVFHAGPFADGTNNIGEYLAIIHAAALFKRQGNTTTPIYTDSRTALAWIRAGHSRTKIEPTDANAPLRAILARADSWLANNRIVNPIIKWETERWGEIPADFGRK